MTDARFDIETMLEMLRKARSTLRSATADCLFPAVLGAPDIDVESLMRKFEQDTKLLEAMVNSMTVEERRHPEMVDDRRADRIALGSGVNSAEVRRLLKDFVRFSKMMQDREFSGALSTWRWQPRGPISRENEWN